MTKPLGSNAHFLGIDVPNDGLLVAYVRQSPYAAQETPLKPTLVLVLSMVAAAAFWSDCRLATAQTVNPTYADQLKLSFVVGVNPPGSVPSMGLITQMAWHPDEQQLFVASYELGIVRFNYSYDSLSETTSLTNATLIWQNPMSDLGTRGSLGLAFHQDPLLGTVLYFNEAVRFIPGYQSSVTAETARLQTVRRITDSNGDGTWGGAGDVNQAILNNVQVNTQHQINNFATRGNTLFMGIGTQTIPGNHETAYTGTISWIEDLTLLGGDTTTANLAGFDTPPGNGLGADGHHIDTHPFTSSDKSKLRVYSTGSRNPFGIAVEGQNRNGDLWFSMNQQEEDVQGGLKPDEFHRTFYQADHGFPKWYQTDGNLCNAHLIGPIPPNTTPEQISTPPVDIQMNPLDDNITNWKTDPTALAAGFFDPINTVAPWVTLGLHASADGFDFYYGSNSTFDGDAFVARFGPHDDIRAIDTATAQQISVVSGLLNPLTVLRAPGGLLLADSNAIYFLRFVGDIVGIPGDYNLNGIVDAADYAVWRNTLGQSGRWPPRRRQRQRPNRHRRLRCMACSLRANSQCRQWRRGKHDRPRAVQLAVGPDRRLCFSCRPSAVS